MRTSLGSIPAASLGTALALSLLVGCGDETRVVADPSATNTLASSIPAPEAKEWRLVALVWETAAGGSFSTEVTPVSDPDDLSTYLDQFGSEALAQKVTDAVDEAEPGPGQVVGAAVVSVGCDVPTEVTYVDGVIRAKKVPNPLPECFAPVTTVAVVEIPAEG